MSDPLGASEYALWLWGDVGIAIQGGAATMKQYEQSASAGKGGPIIGNPFERGGVERGIVSVLSLHDSFVCIGESQRVSRISKTTLDSFAVVSC